MVTLQNIYKIFCYLVQRIPVIGLLGYTFLKWRYYLGTFLILFLGYIILRNLVCMLTDTGKLTRSTNLFKVMIFLDLWYWLARVSDFFCVDISYPRSALEIIGLGKECPLVKKEVVQVNEDVAVYVYTPESTDNKGCVMYVHGGGWNYLSAYAYNPTMSWMSHYLKMVVVSVEYRLAPEHPFPAALTDCYNSLMWIYRNKHKLGIDTDKIFVAGDSAGGNLSAALCLLHSDRQGTGLDGDDEPKPAIAGQILMYPVLQVYNFYTAGSMVYNGRYFPYPSSMGKCTSRYILGNDKMENVLGRPECFEKVPKFWGVVNNVLLEEDEIMQSHRTLVATQSTSVMETANGYLFPLHDNNLPKLPPAYILVASADTLRDEGIWYAEYLKKFGNNAVLKEARSCHGFMMAYQENELARNELMEIKQFIDKTLKDL